MILSHVRRASSALGRSHIARPACFMTHPRCVGDSQCAGCPMHKGEAIQRQTYMSPCVLIFSAAGTTTTPITANGAPSTTTKNGGSPYVTTPSTGVLGGVGSGLGPSGPGINDESRAGVLLERRSIFPLLITLVLAGLVLIFG